MKIPVEQRGDLGFSNSKFIAMVFSKRDFGKLLRQVNLLQVPRCLVTKKDSFALVRAKLFKPTNQWNVPPGTWFNAPSKMDDMHLPNELSKVHIKLVKSSGTDVVSWDSRLHAHLTSDIDINLLIQFIFQ